MSITCINDCAGRPVITNTQNNINSVTGNSVELRCPVSGDPTPRITWRKDNSPIVSDSRHVLTDSGSLVIRSLRASDAGVYSCVASNIHGRSTHSVSVEVSTVTTRRTRINLDSTVRLTCTFRFDGIVSRDVRWLHNGMPVVSGGRYDVNPSGTLTITGVDRSDRGIYRCYADSVGSTQAVDWDLVVAERR